MASSLAPLILCILFSSGLATQESGASTSSPDYAAFNKDFAFNLHSNLGDKIVGWNNAEVEQGSEVAYEYDTEYDAKTPLGRIKAFIGDLTYPAFVGAFAVLSVFILVQFAFQVFGFAAASKTAVFKSLNEWFVSTPFFEKFFATYIDVDEAARSARQLNGPYADRIVNMIRTTLEGIEAAKAKYEE